MLKRKRDQGNQRVQTVCLLILTLIASGVALAMLRPVLVPFVLALFFTYSLSPVIDLQMRWFRIPRGAAIGGAAIVGLVVAALLGLGVAASVGTMSHNLAMYHERFHQFDERIAQSPLLHRLGVRPQTETGGLLFTIPETATTATITFVYGVLGETTTVVAYSLAVVVFVIFILLGRSDGKPPPSGLLAEIETRVKRYIGQTVFFSALTGLLVAATLGVLGVEFAGVFGFLAFLLNFIPTVGAIIATLLPLPVVLLSPDLSITARVLALALPGGIEFVIGYLIQPKVQGGSLELHPVVVLMALIFFGMIWGPVGAFLAMPITGAIKIIFERIDATRPLAAAMAGELDGLSARLDVAARKPHTGADVASEAYVSSER